MAPEMLLTEEAEELRQLAAQIRDWQEARGFSDKEMERKFGGIGSTKTYKRILADDLAELNLEKQLANYRSVWALVEAISNQNTTEEELYDDLTPALQLRRAFIDVIEEKSIARVILFEGDTGTGKSSALVRLVEKYGQRILPMQCWDAWDDSPMALLGGILDGFGEKFQPFSLVARLRLVVQHLKARRVFLAFDEAHHLGPRQLNTIKGLVNETPGEFGLLAMPTLWKKIERDAWQEVRQLTGNRLAERIRIDGINQSDVKKLLERRARVVDPRAIRHVADEARSGGAKNRGNLQFVSKVCRALVEKHPDTVPELEDVVAAVKAEAARR